MILECAYCDSLEGFGPADRARLTQEHIKTGLCGRRTRNFGRFQLGFRRGDADLIWDCQVTDDHVDLLLTEDGVRALVAEARGLEADMKCTLAGLCPMCAKPAHDGSCLKDLP